jgi:DNA-binding NarL/FixJ family response regulator
MQDSPTLGTSWCRSGLRNRYATFDRRPEADVHDLRIQTSVVIAHPHPETRQQLCGVLAGDADIVLSDQVSTAASLLAAVEFHRPQVCVVDASLHGGALSAIESITGRTGTAAVLTTVQDDSRALLEAILAGVSAYLISPIAEEHLRDAVHAVLQGLIVFPRHLAPGLAEDETIRVRRR